MDSTPTFEMKLVAWAACVERSCNAIDLVRGVGAEGAWMMDLDRPCRGAAGGGRGMATGLAAGTPAAQATVFTVPVLPEEGQNRKGRTHGHGLRWRKEQKSLARAGTTVHFVPSSATTSMDEHPELGMRFVSGLLWCRFNDSSLARRRRTDPMFGRPSGRGLIKLARE